MKIINEDFEYSKEDILQYVKNLENACSELRSCLYALSNSLEEEYPELNTMVKGSIVNFDDFHEYILSDLNDIKDGLNPQEDEEDYNESLNEEMWDSARVLDIARYCWDNGYTDLQANKIVINQMKKEGSKLPSNLDIIQTLVSDYYDEFSDEEEN